MIILGECLSCGTAAGCAEYFKGTNRREGVREGWMDGELRENEVRQKKTNTEVEHKRDILLFSINEMDVECV